MIYFFCSSVNLEKAIIYWAVEQNKKHTKKSTPITNVLRERERKKRIVEVESKNYEMFDIERTVQMFDHTLSLTSSLCNDSNKDF